ncbi:hypothetical protein [Clostridium botulinum]|uniref:hypothetical protein n=1 Tax=Clostridium botulinum TaxID=1491 RepID=UPI0004A59C3C|nr:hypothetical protein [Clostridium botulinum]KEI94975.1 hypothetical protein N496_18560 [Clostridium botulinum A2B3 87]MCC5425377.1 hypothetical protein [Clostridium botulinum]
MDTHRLVEVLEGSDDRRIGIRSLGGILKNGSNRNIKKEIIKLRNEAWENRKISSKGDEIYKIIEEKEKQITHKLCPYRFTNSEL